MGEDMAKKFGMKYMESSAKTGYGVDDIFNGIADEIIRQRIPHIE